MYYYIKGTPVRKGVNYVVIDVHGVGYMIYTSQTSINSIKDSDRDVIMYTKFIVREDAQELYGFTSEEEKNLFESLISVSGVGPKAAAAILSVASAAEIARAVITDDVKTITKAQGVGAKIAKRIILELREKIKNSSLNIEGATAETEETAKENDARSDAVSALIALGYGRDEAYKAVSTVKDDAAVDSIIKQALKSLM